MINNTTLKNAAIEAVKCRQTKNLMNLLKHHFSPTSFENKMLIKILRVR